MHVVTSFPHCGTFSNTVMYAKITPERKFILLICIFMYTYINDCIVFSTKTFQCSETNDFGFIFSVLLKSWYIWHCTSTPFTWRNIVLWVLYYFIVFKYYVKMMYYKCTRVIVHSSVSYIQAHIRGKICVLNHNSDMGKQRI